MIWNNEAEFGLELPSFAFIPVFSLSLLFLPFVGQATDDFLRGQN